MEIKIANYIISSDIHQYILREYVEESKKGRKEDGAYPGYKIIGFYGEFGSLLFDLMERRLRKSEINSLEEVMESLKETEKLAREIGETVNKIEPTERLKRLQEKSKEKDLVLKETKAKAKTKKEEISDSKKTKAKTKSKEKETPKTKTSKAKEPNAKAKAKEEKPKPKPKASKTKEKKE